MNWPLLLLAVAPTTPGVYLKSDVITDRADPMYSASVNRVVHPIGFTGAGGALTVRVCVDSDPRNTGLIAPTQRAVTRWNALQPTTGTYSRNGGRGRPDAESVLLQATTQDPMISIPLDEARYRGLIADNVNMVKLGMAGLDDLAGTADDYTLTVIYQPDCSGADVRIQFVDSPDPLFFAECQADLPTVVSGKHYRMTALPGTQLSVAINENLDWDYGAEVPIFFDPFESGDLSAWDGVVP